MNRDWRKFLLTWIISPNEELFWLAFCQNVEFIRLKMVFVIVELACDTEVKNWLKFSTSSQSQHFIRSFSVLSAFSFLW